MKRVYLLLALGAVFASMASAGLVAPGCVGYCGTLGANGVVTVPEIGLQYQWVSSYNGFDGVGALEGVGGTGSATNGSTLASATFSGNQGEAVSFLFNYVTSDGAGYADYAWARLLSDDESAPILLFTARTTTGASTVPGTSMPSPIATLDPAEVPIVAGGPTWAPLGGTSSGSCYAEGCGYTGWVQASYILQTSGTYQLQVGVTNWSDSSYDSGLAVLGLRVADTDIDIDTGGAVPEPSTMILLGAGLGLVAIARRKRA